MKNIKNVKFILILILIQLLFFFFLYKIFFSQQNSYFNITYIEKLSSASNNSKNPNITHIGKWTQSYVTIISIYFPLEKSKHSSIYYEKWLKRMFQYVQSPIIFFTNDYMYNIIKFSKNVTSSPITFIRYDNIWEILKFVETERKKNYTFQYKYFQNKKDPEKNLHNPELYAVWNLKLFLCNMSATMNFYNSSFFIYTDSGAWRDGVFTNWPDVDQVKRIHNKIGDKFLSGEIETFKTPTDLSIEGTFFAGSRNAIKEYASEYYRVHDERLDNLQFVGKDQTNMNIVTFVTKKELVVRLITKNLNCSKNYDKWFFYQYYFASDQEYICE